MVAAEISIESPDTANLRPMVETANAELKSADVDDRPGVVLADAGYWKNEAIEALVGRLELDEWEADHGAKRSRLYVIAQSVQFLAGKPAAEQPATAAVDGGDPEPDPNPYLDEADRLADRIAVIDNGNYAFGGAGESYVDFLMPGIMVLTAIFGSILSGVGLSQDMQRGIVDRLRSLPMATSAVLVGRTASDLVRNVATLALVFAVGLLVGFRPSVPAPRVLAAPGCSRSRSPAPRSCRPTPCPAPSRRSRT